MRADALATAERLAAGRFFVACLGQFKRGKSTLINALVSDAVLPVGVVPVTSVVTVVRYGPARGAIIHFQNGTSTPIDVANISDYVSEAGNPGNGKAVSLVETIVPAPLLASGLCLVDTPGVGSVFEANTETTRAFVPRIDAALMVCGADPPLTKEELFLIEQATQEASRFVFVLNKADRVSASEREEAASFAARQLQARVGIDIRPILNVSALRVLQGEDSYDWTLLTHRLLQLSGELARFDMARSARRAEERIRADLLRVVIEQIDALQRPLLESAERIERLQSLRMRIDGLLQDLEPLLLDAERRLTAHFRVAQETFTTTAIPHGRRLVCKEVAALPSSAQSRERAFEIANDAARALVMAWLRDAEPTANALFRESVSRLTATASDAFARLVAALDVVAMPIDGEDIAEDLAGRRRFYFTSLMSRTARNPLATAWNVITGKGHEAVIDDAERYFVQLLNTNASRAATDVIERLHESRNRLRKRLNERLSSIVIEAQAAAEHAKALHDSGQHAVAEEHQRLEVLRRNLNPRPEGSL